MASRLIHVTEHAITQHLERWPDLPEWDRERRRNLICLEVSSALSDGRYSTKEPSWSGNGRRVVGKRNGNERDRSLRFCWTRDEGRIYLVDRGDRVVRVVTSILPNER